MTQTKEARCVHCLKTTVDWNWEHIFPESWYPESTPPNLEKWQVPSCKECNTKYGEIESDLMIRVGLCLDPTDSRCAGIPQKAIRAVSPRYGKTPKDKAARLAKRNEILGKSCFGKDIPDQGVYPGLGNRWGLPKKECIPITVPAEAIQKVTEKIVRGIFLLEDKSYIEPPFKISFWAMHEAGAKDIKAIIQKHGQVYAREPGIIVQRAVAPEDNRSSLFFIEIWGQFRMYASIERDNTSMTA